MADATLQIKADTTEFERQIRRARRLIYWPALWRALLCGLLGGVVGSVLTRVFS